ncbi:phosphatase PAP2 family protein [Micromonospora endolithica]|uniref:Phosphatase PAP2 family protein n=1 Tax=Micromonospora endolithica TaxID=230091 RepID=A0A3A9Z2Q8_9ACTN|nr:phosphatase PAP2 family protein [Micromonospora endolithica]RKN42742.1 phosphatase PAP2 family protein [Micromonospora endolithica]TWJ25414.1 undecaprenyl-diphosphatase [Micromonospora endolithica]
MSSSGPRTLSPGTRSSWPRRRLDPDHSLGLRLTLAAAGAFLVLVPFALLALFVLSSSSPLHRWDATVTDRLHGWALDRPGWTRFLNVWTDVFGPLPLRVAALVLVVWLVRRQARRLALWVTVTMVVGGLLGPLLKLLVGRDRPDLLDPVAHATGYAFPSGHALNAALAAGVLLVVFLPSAVAPARRVALWVAALVLVGLTGFTRVALGVHWTSDVMGGWLLGAAVVAATTAAFTTWRHRVDLPPVRVTGDGGDPGERDAPRRFG